MAAEIYYFSGTGNSLAVAKELQARLPGAELLPLVHRIRSGQPLSGGETVGIVFPVHHCTVPGVVMDFLSLTDLSQTKYIFALATCCGCPNRPVTGRLKRALRRHGRRLDAFQLLNMPSNDPKFAQWHPASGEELARLEEDLRVRLDRLCAKISGGETYLPEDHPVLVPMHPFLEYLGDFADRVSGSRGDAFLADGKCSGCGLCAQVCLSGKIAMAGQRPIWQQDQPCYNCYACINYCPEQAIQVKPSRMIKICTAENGRYHHPRAAATDIIQQK